MISPFSSRARALGRELRAARERMQLTQTELGQRLGWDKHKVSRVELGRGKQRMSELELGWYLDAVEIQGAARDRLMRLNGEPHHRAWWEFSGETSPQFGELVVAERRATGISRVCINLIPGLLQTAAYSRAIITTSPDASATVDDRVAVRQARRSILTSTHPARFTCFIDEAVLTRVVGAPETMAEQLRALEQQADLPNVELRIVPFAEGAYQGMDNGFTLLEFMADDPVVYIEQMGASVVTSDPEITHEFRSALRDLRGCALSGEESRDMIAGYRDRYENDLGSCPQ